MTKLSENLPIEEARERLRQLIMELAVVRGHVVLASGKEADYYVDLRRITLHHEASRLVGQVMLDLLDKNGTPLPDDVIERYLAEHDDCDTNGQQ